MNLVTEERFTVEYLDSQTIALKASNGKYVTASVNAKLQNQLAANKGSIGPTEKFTIVQSGYYQVQVTSDSEVLSIIDGKYNGRGQINYQDI